MKEKINLAIIGLGQRGSGLLNSVLIKLDDVNIVGVCDPYQDRADSAAQLIEKEKSVKPFVTTDYKTIFDIKGLDAVLVSAAWEFHTEISIYAMQKHVAVAMEVGGAYSIKELWDLVHTYEETKTPFMFMENCCYNKTELLATSMAKKGLFGTIVHASGSYSHDLRSEVCGGNINRHYRLRNYLSRNCDNYPTHDIGPIAKLLDINCGNKFTTLVSVASKSAGLKEYVDNHKDKYPELVGKDFQQGDIVYTIITCANGETVTLKLDTTLPRFYARDFTVRGTKGFYEQNTDLVFIEEENMKEEWDTVDAYKKRIGSGEKYSEYLPDEWKNVTKEQLDSGHGGMDYFEFKDFISKLKNGEEMAIDVYDAATWMAISVLSEESVSMKGSPVTVPDFTSGKWLLRKPKKILGI